MNNKPAAERELYIKPETDEEKQLRENENNSIINDPLEVQEHLRSLFEAEEQTRQFDKNRGNEVFEYQQKIVEAKTQEELRIIETLIWNRIWILNKFPELRTTQKDLKVVVKYCESKLRAMTNNISKAQLTESIKVPELKDNSELKQKAYDMLVVLSGNWLNGEKIMTDEQFKTVVEAVYHLIDSGEVKPIDKKDRIKTPATMIFIRRLFWEINNELYKGKSTKKESFVKLLHTYFECFFNSDYKTTANNFKEYRSGNFEVNYKEILDSIKK
jgi:hypothetical protein